MLSFVHESETFCWSEVVGQQQDGVEFPLKVGLSNILRSAAAFRPISAGSISARAADHLSREALITAVGSGFVCFVATEQNFRKSLQKSREEPFITLQRTRLRMSPNEDLTRVGTMQDYYSEHLCRLGWRGMVVTLCNVRSGSHPLVGSSVCSVI